MNDDHVRKRLFAMMYKLMVFFQVSSFMIFSKKTSDSEA